MQPAERLAGIYRVHQFTKVEMFGYAGPDVKESDALHLEILRIEEEIFQGTGDSVPCY
ncbi:MAG UNVERIFIED_CONTAM: hypothetical protein LVR18_49500 [Planctomycetaceae bacterium]